jgi:hypothetical protein
MDTPEAVISALGIVGTLAGVFFGYRGALQAVELQLEHEDRVRFHELKLQAFVDFIDATSSLVAIATIAKPPLEPVQGAIHTEALKAFNASFKRISLCCTEPVTKATAKLQAMMTPVVKMKDVDDPTRDSIIAQLILVERAMRAELGVDKTEMRKAPAASTGA